MSERVEGRCPRCGADAPAAEGSSLEALEARVPDAWVEAMWPAVERATGRRGRRGLRRWGLPLLAAASVVLLFGTVVSTLALDETRRRVADLEGQVLAIERARTGLGARQGGITGRPVGLAATAAWRRALDTGGDLSVDEARELLRRLPPGTSVLSGARGSALATFPLVPPEWRAVLSDRDPVADWTARELLEAMDRLDLPGGARIPTSRLADLLG